MESNIITENKKRKPNWTEDEKAILLEEYAKRKKTPCKVNITHLSLIYTRRKPGRR